MFHWPQGRSDSVLMTGYSSVTQNVLYCLSLDKTSPIVPAVNPKCFHLHRDQNVRKHSSLAKQDGGLSIMTS